MGKVGKVRYNFNRYLYTVTGYLDDITWSLIEGVDLDNPPLDVDDKIYIVSLQKATRVIDVIRSTDNSYVYYTDHVIERIEDEETLKSKEDAEQQKKDFFEERQSVRNKVLNEQEKEKQPKKWYQIWR